MSNFSIPLFSVGFRPFFLLAGLGALLPVAFRYESARGMEMATAAQQPVVCALQPS